MAEKIKNPPRALCDMTCGKCDLLPTKPGFETYPAYIVAASQTAAEMDRLIQPGRQVTIDDYSARCWAAYNGLLSGRNRSERERYKELDKHQTAKDKAHEMFKSGEGMMD